MKELIKNITEIYSPSGREDEVRNFIISQIKDYVDEYKIDKIGNLIAFKKGRSGKTILFDAHMDEIGLVITHISDNGFYKVEAVGGVDPQTLIGCRVQFKNRTGVLGVEGETLEDLKNNSKNLSFENLYLDLGFSCRTQAEEFAPIGTFGTYTACFADLGDRIVSKAMDDRVACAVLIESIRNMKDSLNNIIYAFTVQEEVGLVGSSVAGFNYDIDMAVAVDVTAAGDTPKALKRISMELGKGPCIKIKDAASVSDISVVNKLKQAAQANMIPFQFEVLLFGGTNAASYQRTKSGIPSGTISITTRYVHSPNEMVSMDDVKNTVKLVAALSNTEI